MKTKNVFMSVVVLLAGICGSNALAQSTADSIQAAESAINHRDVQTLDKLLDSGAVNANDKTEKGTPFLMLAMRQGYTMDPDDIMPVVSSLLRHGADPDVTETFRGFPETPMIAAIRMGRPKTAGLLIQNHADINQQTCYVAKPSWLSSLFGAKPGLDYGTVLDVAESQLLTEKGIAMSGDRGPDDASGLSHISEVNSIIGQLKAAGAIHWDPSTMQCNAAGALGGTVVSDKSDKSNADRNTVQTQASGASKGAAGGI